MGKRKPKKVAFQTSSWLAGALERAFLLVEPGADAHFPFILYLSHHPRLVSLNQQTPPELRQTPVVVPFRI